MAKNVPRNYLSSIRGIGAEIATVSQGRFHQVVKLLLHSVIAFLGDWEAVRAEDGTPDVKVLHLGADLAVEYGEQRVGLQTHHQQRAVLAQRGPLPVRTPRVHSAADAIPRLHHGDFESEMA